MDALTRLGFPEALGDQIVRNLGSPKAMDRMTSYLNNVKPKIEDSKKNFYYRGLKEWRNEKGWLTDTCLDGQDTFARLLDMLEIAL